MHSHPASSPERWLPLAESQTDPILTCSACISVGLPFSLCSTFQSVIFLLPQYTYLFVTASAPEAYFGSVTAVTTHHWSENIINIKEVTTI